MKILFASFLFVFALGNLLAQEKPLTQEEQFQKEYAKRIKKERLYGVYIPKDIPDAFTQLNKLTARESKAAFKSVPENIAVKKLHFSLGRWITHNWGFYEGSRLSHYLKGLGTSHPEDQAKVIIIAYHRYLNKQPIKLKELGTQFQEARKKMLEERKNKGEVIFKEKRKRSN